ncbi:hypothetical protein [Streptosporangium sp. NPDC048865]|uniref:hypothetical protein n=1 Tax=Streptosporangium sp. NPDC048865 TaxID=3155766 RepID=UPI00341CAC76
MTHLVCVPWNEIEAAGWPISYRALHDALNRESLSGSAPVQLTVGDYDHRRLAGQVNGTARTAAALLLTGRHVCVVRGEHLSYEERLDFLDSVAALLPYGLRAELAVSTWTKSSSPHDIRLSFTENGPLAGAFEVQWENDPSQTAESLEGVPSYAREYERELNRFHGSSLGDLIAMLGTQVTPLSFNRPGDCRQALALVKAQSSALSPEPAGSEYEGGSKNEGGRGARRASHTSVWHLLSSSLDSVATLDRWRLKDLNPELRALVQKDIPGEERRFYRKFVRENWRQVEPDVLDWPETRELFSLLVDLLLARPAHAVDIDELAEDFGTESRLTELFHDALVPLIHTNRLSFPAKLLVAYHRDRGQLDSLLGGERIEDLLRAVGEARSRVVLEVVLDELESGSATDVVEALKEHRYLVEVIGIVCGGEDRISCYRRVVRLALGRNPSPAGLKEILGSLDHIPAAFRLAAVAEAPQEGAPVLLEEVVRSDMHALAIGGSLAGEIQENLRWITSYPPMWALPEDFERSDPAGSYVDRHVIAIVVSGVTFVSLVAVAVLLLVLRNPQ